MRGYGRRALKNCGYKITRAREAIVKVLEEREGAHMSIEEIYEAVHRDNPDVGLTSVYRTLEILVDLSLVRRLDFGEGRARYESNFGEEGHHHHLVCKRCAKVIDYTDFVSEEVSLIEKTQKALEDKYGFKIESHMLQFWGVCPSCAK